MVESSLYTNSTSASFQSGWPAIRSLRGHADLQVPHAVRYGDPASEIFGGSLRDPANFYSLGAIGQGDVAVPAFLGTGDTAGRDVVCEPPDQGAHVVDELGCYRGSGAADVGVGIPDLAGGSLLLEPRQRLRDGVLVDLDLGPVRGAPLSGLGIGDEDLVGLFAYEVRLSGDGGGGASQAEEVLVLGVDLVADDLETIPFPVDQGGVLEHPAGAVEIGGRLLPVLVMGLEPTGPLAGVLAGQQLG